MPAVHADAAHPLHFGAGLVRRPVDQFDVVDDAAGEAAATDDGLGFGQVGHGADVVDADAEFVPYLFDDVVERRHAAVVDDAADVQPITHGQVALHPGQGEFPEAFLAHHGRGAERRRVDQHVGTRRPVGGGFLPVEVRAFAQ